MTPAQHRPPRQPFSLLDWGRAGARTFSDRSLSLPDSAWIGLASGLHRPALGEEGLWVQIVDRRVLQNWQEHFQSSSDTELAAARGRGVMPLSSFPASLEMRMRRLLTAGSNRRDPQATQPLLPGLCPTQTPLLGGRQVRPAEWDDQLSFWVRIHRNHQWEWVESPHFSRQQVRVWMGWLNILASSQQDQQTNFRKLLQTFPAQARQLIEQVGYLDQQGQPLPFRLNPETRSLLIQQTSDERKGEMMRLAARLSTDR